MSTNGLTNYGKLISIVNTIVKSTYQSYSI